MVTSYSFITIVRHASALEIQRYIAFASKPFTDITIVNKRARKRGECLRLASKQQKQRHTHTQTHEREREREKKSVLIKRL